MLKHVKTYYIPIQSFLKPFETARHIGSGSSFPPLYIDASSPDGASENSAQQCAVHGKGEFNHPHLIATTKHGEIWMSQWKVKKKSIGPIKETHIFK